jgi:hypothetical protein
MEHEEVLDNTGSDVAHNWVSTSRFLFICTVFIALAWLIGGTYNLYRHRYMGHPEVNVPGNTLYSPTYK